MLTAMAKPGRNDRCPCGSGKKYKACCLTKDEAAERKMLAEAEFRRAERVAERNPGLMHELKTAIATKLGMPEADLRRYDELMDASNAAVELVQAGKLDEAEAAARDLLAHFPDEPDGWDRLGLVHEKRGENALAADCYRKVADFIRQHPDDYSPEMAEEFAARAAKLDPAATV